MPADPRPTIAFLGTGLMGRPMAERLLDAGFPLRVWNRTPAKAEPLVARGASLCASPAAAAAEADCAILMLTDADVVEQILFDEGVAAGLAPGALVIDMSSIPPERARAHSARLAASGRRHLDAPVSGGTRGAAAGTLAIMVGGEPAAFAAAEPVLRHLGRPTAVGPAGSGQLAKLANQVIVAVTIGAVAEALLLAAAGGADPAAVRDALRGGFAESVVLDQHGGRMVERAWTPGGPMRIQVKDLKAIAAEAAALQLDLPLLETAGRLFASGLAAGLGEHDHSALLLELERHNPGRRVTDRPDRL